MKTKQKHPLAARIKRLMQTDEDVGKIASATPVLIGRAMELLLQKLCEGMCDIASPRNAKTITPAHLKQCVMNNKLLDFLQEVVSNAPDLTNDVDPAPKLKRQRTADPDPSSPGPSSRGRGRPPGPGRGRGNPSLPPPVPPQPVLGQSHSAPSGGSLRNQLRSSLLQPSPSHPPPLSVSGAPDACSRPVQPSTTSARVTSPFATQPLAAVAASTASNTRYTHKEATASSSDLPQRSVAASVDSSLPLTTAQGSTGSVHLPLNKKSRSRPPAAAETGEATNAVPDMAEEAPPAAASAVAVATFTPPSTLPDNYDDDYDS